VPANPHTPTTGRNQLPEGLLEQLFDRIGEISSLPHLAVQIVGLVNDSKTEADDLVELVRCDPSLVMRLMRTVNSSYYALRDKVGDLKQAVTLLGFEEIRNLALTAHVAPLFSEAAGHGQYTRQGLWNHMIATGMVAQLIAKVCGNLSRQEAYLAGLLHDVGLILIDQYLHQRFCQILDELTEETPLCEVEARILGFDHAALGGHMVGKWSLPESLGAATAHHHAPDLYDGPFRQLVGTVSLADYLTQRRGLMPLGAGREPALPAQLVDQIGLTREGVVSVVERLDDVLAEANVMADAQLSHAL